MQKYAEEVIFAARVSSRGLTAIYFVSPTSKVDHQFFTNKILTLIVEKDILRLHQGGERKVILHFDSASSHTTPAVYQYLDYHNLNHKTKEEWMSNTLGLTPMDYDSNRIFKESMFWKTPKDDELMSLKRRARQACENFPLPEITMLWSPGKQEWNLS
jgi:hypothetical protein